MKFKTIAKTRIEKGEIFYRKGHFIESLKWYLEAIMDIIQISLYRGEKNRGEDEKGRRYEMYCGIRRVVKQLNELKRDLIFDKEKIREFFDPDYPDKGDSVFIKKPSSEYVLDESLKEMIDKSYRLVAAEVLVKIGFILYTLRRHRVNKDTTEEDKNRKSYISPFFNQPLGIKTSFGSYLQCIFSPEHEFYYNDFAGDYERLFAAAAFSIFNRERVSRKEKVLPLEKLALNLGIKTMADIDNMVTIPKMLNSFLMRDGYKSRAREVRKDNSPANKLVVLRRWQSFNPKIPRPHGMHVPGGGYFLIWQNKGIVIDPGPHFVQNLYDEGFSLDDIDAVIVTHSHIDHDDELSTILTLIHEWKEFWGKSLDDKKAEKKIDLFLNEGSYRKFNPWIYSPTGVVNKIYQLQLNVWNLDSKSPDCQHRKGENIVIDLKDRDGYAMEIEVIPAWHNEIIARHSAIGVKLRLYTNEEKAKLAFIIGVTGDTEAYRSMETQYSDCDIILAHLGDIKFKEVMTLAKIDLQTKKYREEFFKKECHAPKRIKDFLRFLAAIDIVDITKELNEEEKAILKRFIEKGDYGDRAQSIIQKLLEKIEEIKEIVPPDIKELIKKVLDEGLNCLGDKEKEEISKFVKEQLENIGTILTGEEIRLFQLCLETDIEINAHKIKPIIRKIFERINQEYKYKNHMGVEGVYKLYKQMYEKADNDKWKLFIITEIPEELASFRHILARELDSIVKEEGKKIRCVTGDIGLHVALGMKKTGSIKIRCYRCNQNSEMVKEGDHYHSPEQIQETIVKKADARMIYLCKTFGHAIGPDYEDAKYFLSMPDLRDI